MRKPQRVGADGVARRGTEHERRRDTPKAALWQSSRYRKARLEAFERDGYLCRFCGKPTIPGHPKMKPTAAHYPLAVEELIARGLDPCDPETIVCAHAECHGRQDAERQHA
jgi:hypothetical protein